MVIIITRTQNGVIHKVERNNSPELVISVGDLIETDKYT